jgi:hypothetical protein
MPCSIVGADFGTTAGTLTVGGSAVTPSAWTNTIITFNIPAHATGKVNIVVTDTMLASDTYTDAIEYVSALDPVRTRIREAVRSGLFTITTGNAYRNTIKRVYDPPANMEKMVEFPSINLLWGDEQETEERLAGNNPLLDLSMNLEMDCFLQANDTMTDIDKLIADIQTYFGKHYYIPDGYGARTAFNCLYMGATPFGTDVTKPNCGVTIRMRIWYRINLDDPTVDA